MFAHVVIDGTPALVIVVVIVLYTIVMFTIGAKYGKQIERTERRSRLPQSDRIEIESRRNELEEGYALYEASLETVRCILQKNWHIGVSMDDMGFSKEEIAGFVRKGAERSAFTIIEHLRTAEDLENFSKLETNLRFEIEKTGEPSSSFIRENDLQNMRDRFLSQPVEQRHED